MQALSKAIALSIALLGLVAAQAASVTGGGYTNDFSSRPAVADFSTSTGIPGASGDIDTVAELDSAVQTVTASTVNLQVSDASGNTPNNPPAKLSSAMWTSAGGAYLLTRPTANKASLLLATLVNNTGTNCNALQFQYQLTVAVNLSEEVPGQRLYYSFTGLANSWLPLPAVSGLNSSQLVNATVALGQTWNNGSPLYLLWADDNALESTESAYEIDNFYASAWYTNFPVTITLSSPTAGQHIAAGMLIDASVALTGSPTEVRYYVDNILVTNRTSAPFSPVTLPAQAVGTHTLYAAAFSSANTWVSTATNTFYVDVLANFITGVSDKTVYTDTATFTVLTTAGYGYNATLNNAPVPVGTPVTIDRMDYYDLLAWRTNQSPPFDITSNYVRFIIIASDRGSPEHGLIKWTPYPRIYSTEAEFAGAQLHMMMPQNYPQGLPIPVIVRVDDGQGNERRCNGEVNAPGFEGYGIQVIRGLGSGFLPAATAGGTINYNAALYGLQAPRQIQIDPDTTWTPISGVLPASTQWPENSRIFITGNFTIPAGLTLSVGAGTIVKLNPLVNITNTGVLMLNGTTARPVVFTATNVVYPEKNAGAWGGFLLRGATAQLIANGTIFAGGGGASSFDFNPSSSHKSEQAVLLVHSGAKAYLTNCAIINTAGQVHNGYSSELIYDHCLCQRAITGGECSGSTGLVVINHSGFIEFPADNGIVNATIASADYDALYFTEGEHYILNSLVGFCMDDCLDSGSGGAGTMMVSNCWLESSLHEANAWSGSGRRECWTYDSVLMNCGQGFENGWSDIDDTPICHADRMLSTANSVGCRTGDNYLTWSYRGYMNVTNSFVLYNYRDLFLKTWNPPASSGWDTNSWVDRVGQCHFGTNYFTTIDPRFPSNLQYDPALHGAYLTHWMTTPPTAPVGIGLALRTNRLTLAQITNGVPVRLSSFTTNFVSIDYTFIGTNGTVAEGTLSFAPGETLKNIPSLSPTTDNQVLEVVLKKPAHCEITTLAQAWYLSAPPATNSPVTLVAGNSTWRYLASGADAGTAWRTLGYPDNTWSNGMAQLGFGDGDEHLPQLPRTNSAGAVIITYYFRQTFTAADPSAFANLSLWLLRDDGGVVYLNGTEVYRSDSMPAGTITYQTLATNYNGGVAPPDNTIDLATLSPGTLVASTNIVAVEIHQQATSSSDMSFDFSLVGNPPRVSGSPPVIVQVPTNQSVALGSTVVLRVVAAGDEPMAYQWFHNAIPLPTPNISPTLILANVTAADAGSYYVLVMNPAGSATTPPVLLTVGDSDTDQDGMPDVWELAHGLIVGVNDANLDPDGDGMTNLQEFTAGTDPQDTNSYLKVDGLIPAGSDNSFIIQFKAVADRSYSVLFADVLSTNFWAKLQDIAAAPTNRTVTLTNKAVSTPQRFYRLVTPSENHRP